MVVGTGVGRRLHGEARPAGDGGRGCRRRTAADFDAVVIPGGFAPVTGCAGIPPCSRCVRETYQQGKVVAFICHAGWVPISAGIVRGKHVTSVAVIQDDLRNAGAHWEDREVVVDGKLISSRWPDDLPAFCRADHRGR